MRLGPLRGRLGGVLGCFGAILKRPGGVLNGFGSILGLSWVIPGRPRGDVRRSWGRLGACLGLIPRPSLKSTGVTHFEVPGGPRRRLGVFWARFQASWVGFGIF